MPRCRDRKLDLLATVPLFGDCRPHELVAIGRVAEQAALPDGVVVAAAGDRSRWVHLLVEGTADVRARGRMIGLAGPGAAVGLAAALSGHPFATTVVTAGEVMVFVLPAQAVRHLVDSLPRVASAVARVLSEEVVSLEMSGAGAREPRQLSRPSCIPAVG